MGCYHSLDKYHVIVVVIGVAVIMAFSLYTLGSYTTKPKAGTKVEPVKNLATTTVINSSSNIQKYTKGASRSPSPSIPMATFENREKIENFYSIQFPSKSTVVHSNASGSYTAKLPNGLFSVGLVDIPDNSNVQLYIITQVQSSLKSSLQDFNPVSFNQLNIGGQRAWKLVYTWKNGTKEMGSVKTYVEGSDNAAAITFSGPRYEFIDQTLNSTVIRPVTESFHWIGK
jgi:hypothetical protein